MRRTNRWFFPALVVAAFPIGNAIAADIVVSAAASLSNSFRELGKRYEAKHPGDKIVANFAASDVLLKQIEQGAPADVFASADEQTMDRAAQSNDVDKATRKDFATNTLVLIVGAGAKSPSKLDDIVDSAYAHIAIGNPDSVPAGRYAKEALTTAKLWDELQPQIVPAQNVRQALDYVARGEAQAGFVYATDAETQKEKVHIAMTVPTTTPVRYPIAVTATSQRADAARDFIDFVTSAEGQAVLKKYGFSAP
ncbi:MAG TPA: molybdate ABC transporter substrate-binding protein [Rudaea sp.]|jgi:molybdate transport system substrate-binding protein|nr:molybdate ABC transporter substrate-binding protein [Rudaea sp.]